MTFHLYSTECIFQDLTTNQVVAIAHEHSGLYKMEPQASRKHLKKGGLGKRSSQHSSVIPRDQDRRVAVPKITAIANKACSQLPLDILHARLGHTSVSKMKHISACKNFVTDSFFL